MVSTRQSSENTSAKGKYTFRKLQKTTNGVRSDEENITIMHAFVDQLEFTNLEFVDALRLFLQAFRLPGESQKIDRYMLKFAERYIAGNPQTQFANAGTFVAL